jgi:uncharacterized membrane protein
VVEFITPVFLNGSTWLSHRSGNRQPKTYVKPEAVMTVCELLMMGGVPPEPWLSHRSGNRQPKTYVKPEAAITVFELMMMGGVSPKTC